MYVEFWEHMLLHFSDDLRKQALTSYEYSHALAFEIEARVTTASLSDVLICYLCALGCCLYALGMKIDSHKLHTPSHNQTHCGREKTLTRGCMCFGPEDNDA